MKRITTGILAGFIALCFGSEALPQASASAVPLEPVAGATGILIAKADQEAEKELEEVTEEAKEDAKKIEKDRGKGAGGGISRRSPSRTTA